MRAVTKEVIDIAGRSHVVHKSVVPATKRLVVYFGGDQLLPEAAADMDPYVVRLAQVHVQADLLSRQFPECTVLAIEPCRLADGFACYDSFLVRTTASGEPLGYTGKELKAVGLVHSLAQAALAADPPQQQQPPHPAWVLVGFSKGGVVLNQVLTELAWMAEHCSPEEHTQLRLFLQRLEQVHYVDAGLNSRGAHITDPSTTAALGSAWRAAGGGNGLRVALHGTPRQWNDKRRPWIKREVEVFQKLLQEAQVPVVVRRYFEGEAPSLLMHFRSLEVFDANCLQDIAE